MGEIQTWWLEFWDSERPPFPPSTRIGAGVVASNRFIAACIVDVSRSDVDELDGIVGLKDPWLSAALLKADRAGCNPGGSLYGHQIDRDDPMTACAPRNVIFDRETIERLGVVIGKAS